MISVLMRSHNDIKYVQKTVSMLLEQCIDEEFEILSCDDHSTDGTAEYLNSVSGIRHISPPEGSYVPGKTLNHMISHAGGDKIVFNNADAVPQSRDYLKHLTAPLKDLSVNCVYGNQIPRSNAFYVVRKDYERAFGDGHIACKWHNFFSLVSSAFRKVELLEHPFDETFQYSEDSQWVNRRKVRIVYVKEAVVEHSHNYTLAEVKKRFYNEGVADAQMGKKPVPLMRALLNVFVECLRDHIYLCHHCAFGEFFYAPVYRYVQKISYYRGMKQ